MTKMHHLITISGYLPGLSGYDQDFQTLVCRWIIIMIILIALCFFTGEITRNYSQVDKLWSLIPIAYSWMSVFAFPGSRVIIMAFLVSVWGLRLSYNFYRKGGYSIIPWKGQEDYRWKYLRRTSILKGRFIYGLFNLFFISIYQNIVIFLFSSPLLIAALHKNKSLTIIDILSATFMLIFILTETIADNQLFRFHQEKKMPENKENKYAMSVKKGFLSEGLWKHVRHPNFTSEQAIWISFYFFGVAASGKWINITISGPVLLVLIFQGSTVLTENISSKKYPLYTVYQKSVPKLIPWPFRLFKKNKA